MQALNRNNQNFLKYVVVIFTIAVFIFSQVNSIAYVEALAPDEIFAVSGAMVPNGPDQWPGISADGRYIAFNSSSGNLVSDDNNGFADMFVYDTVTETFERINVNDDEEVSGEGYSGSSHTLSSDGRYVVFYSNGTNLVPGDTNGRYDIFVRDRVAGTTERVNVSTLGVEANNHGWDGSISGDGNIVVFLSSATNLDSTSTNSNSALFAHNRDTGETRQITKGSVSRTWTDGSPNYPEGISHDGMHIVFNSFDNTVDKMVPGGPSSGTYMYDWDTDSVELISQSTAGVPGCCSQDEADISGDGRYVYFVSSSNSLVAGDTNSATDIFVRDTVSDTTTRVVNSHNSSGSSDEPRISADGTKLLFTSLSVFNSDGTTSGVVGSARYWLVDLNTNTFSQLNVTPFSQDLSDYNISDDGSYITMSISSLFYDSTTQLYDVAAGTASLVGQDVVLCPDLGFSRSYESDVSADGRYVAYETTLNHLLAENANNRFAEDIYYYDSVTGETQVASISDTETFSDGSGELSLNPSISADGNFVAFESTTDNFVVGDSNSLSDIFVRDIGAGTTERVNLAAGGVQATGGNSTDASISGDGRYVAFASSASNLVAGDVNGYSDIFVYDRTLDTIKRLQVAGGTAALNPEISSNGLKVTFTIFISGRAQVILYTIADDTFVTVTNGNASSSNPDISSDGSYVAFQSLATDIVAGDTNGVSDVFLYNANTATTTLLSQYNSVLGNSGSFEPKISGDGSKVAFDSLATNLIDSDTNAVSDVFVYTAADGSIQRVSEFTDGSQSPYASTFKNISADGEFVSLTSNNKNFVGTCNMPHDGARVDRTAVYLFDLGSPVVPTAPTVSTAAASDITETTATLNGEITDIGTQTPTERGFEYGLDNTYGTTASEAGSFAAGVFSEAISGLTCNTTYSFRAFATSPDGTGNGSELTFTTSACPAASGGGSSSGSTTNNPISPILTPFVPIIDPLLPSTQNPTSDQEAPATGSSGDSNSSESDSSDSSDSSSEQSPDSVQPVYTPEEPVQDQEAPTNPSRQDSNSVLGGIVNTVSGWFGSRANELPLETLSSAGLATLFILLPLASVMPVFNAVIAAIPLGLSGVQLLYTRYFQNLLSFLGLRKKRRVWGTVYDAQTKQPLDPAVVELIDAETGEVKERAITDLAGRFGFIATEGTFLLKASKTNYSFPSTKETGPTDEIFDNLYHGEKLTLHEGSTLIAPNIPMDPTGFDWNQEAKQRLLPSRLRWQFLVQLVFNTVFIFGFVFAVHNYLQFGGSWNSVVLVSYFVVLALRLLMKPKRLWGVISLHGKPLVNARLELSHTQFNVVMGRGLSSVDGKFFLKVPDPGTYLLTVKNSDGVQILSNQAVEVGKESVLNSEIIL